MSPLESALRLSGISGLSGLQRLSLLNALMQLDNPTVDDYAKLDLKGDRLKAFLTCDEKDIEQSQRWLDEE